MVNKGNQYFFLGGIKLQGFFQRFFALYRPLVSSLNSLLGEYDLSHSLWQVIFYVKNNGPSSLIDIANWYNIEKPSITRRVQLLQEKLLIEVTAGEDKREKIIRLTEKGEELYKACRARITELENQAMEGIPENEKSFIFNALPKIKENILNEMGNKNEQA